MQAFSKWRVLTAFLRPDVAEDHTYIAKRASNIETAARQICQAFQPWAVGDLESRFQHLVNVMRSASLTGIKLFSQPSTFAWRWDPRKSKETGRVTQIVVSPGLQKVADEYGRRLNPVQTLCEKVIASIS